MGEVEEAASAAETAVLEFLRDWKANGIPLDVELPPAIAVALHFATVTFRIRYPSAEPADAIQGEKR
jgi:hypothetical protein